MKSVSLFDLLTDLHLELQSSSKSDLTVPTAWIKRELYHVAIWVFDSS